MGEETTSIICVTLLRFLHTTKCNIKYLIPEWLREDGRDENFEEMSKEVLADTLRVFYPSARQVNSQPYQKQSLVNIRSAINRHLTLPPYNKTWNIMRDPEFIAANKTFAGI